MRSTWWVLFLAAGAGLSASLGACGGYSSLGEVPGGGGEDGTEDGTGGSMSMGAKGGQSHGGSGATGGANGMGASPGMGGTGMGAVGGTETGMGAVAGTETGMGAVGGGSGAIHCMTDFDCPAAPPDCTMCPDGTSACLNISCVEGVCALNNQVCPSGPDSVPCMTDEECPAPSCEMRADGVPCPVAICSMGYCATTITMPQQCMTDAECPSPTCDARVDGMCPVGICTMGYCGVTLPAPETCQGQRCGDTCMRTDGTSGTCNATGGCVDDEPNCSELDFFAIFCDASLDNPNTMDPPAADFMNSTCAKNFCHGKNFVASLDLRPDSGFASRLLEAPATYDDITCADLTECVPDSCPAPGAVWLIDSIDPVASWLLTKSLASSQACGDPMPDINGLTGAKLACLTAIVNATAKLRP